jgi:hypothetical protein
MPQTELEQVWEQVEVEESQTTSQTTTGDELSWNSEEIIGQIEEWIWNMENTNTWIQDQVEWSGLFSHYSNNQLWIAFDYPSTWELETTEDLETPYVFDEVSWQDIPQLDTEILESMSIKIKNLSLYLIKFDDGIYHWPNRWGSSWDTITQIQPSWTGKSGRDVLSDSCGTNEPTFSMWCDWETNPQGVEYLKRSIQYCPMGNDDWNWHCMIELTQYTEYIIYNSHTTLSWILLSDTDFPPNEHKMTDDIFNKIINSLQLI